MSEWPPGALQSVEDAEDAFRTGNLYTIFARTKYPVIEKRDGPIIEAWFERENGEPLLGYAFDNYFHALAYSLKVKHEAELKEADSAPHHKS